eukprot:GHVU01058070.1.p3 GENE.GHVU01058070.1~~GHVU01058070.1.p3  ORF type:complete len:106 (-),score=3.61 GHVU01058070.1:257-574(-)
MHELRPWDRVNSRRACTTGSTELASLLHHLGGGTTTSYRALRCIWRLCHRAKKWEGLFHRPKARPSPGTLEAGARFSPVAKATWLAKRPGKFQTRVGPTLWAGLR